MARHRISTVELKGIFGDRWLLKLEKKAFGWQYYGTSTEDEVGYEISETSSGVRGQTTHKYIDWLEFRRQSPYSNNPLFVIAEALSKVWSFLRRIILGIGGPLFLFFLVITLLDRFACNGSIGISQEGFEIIKYTLILYAACIVLPTAIFCGIGVLIRKIFKVDERLKESLRNDGYDDDLTDCTLAGE